MTTCNGELRADAIGGCECMCRLQGWLQGWLSKGERRYSRTLASVNTRVCVCVHPLALTDPTRHCRCTSHRQR